MPGTDKGNGGNGSNRADGAHEGGGGGERGERGEGGGEERREGGGGGGGGGRAEKLTETKDGGSLRHVGLFVLVLESLKYTERAPSLMENQRMKQRRQLRSCSSH